MNSTEILDALNSRLLQKWPARTVYVDVCPVDFARPSFWLAITRDDSTPVNRFMTKRSVQVKLTIYDELDEHYEASWYRLAGEASDCLQLFSKALSVDGRQLLPTLKSLPRDPDRAYLLLDFSFMDSGCGDGSSAPTAQTADSYQISVHANGGEIYQRSE